MVSLSMTLNDPKIGFQGYDTNQRQILQNDAFYIVQL